MTTPQQPGFKLSPGDIIYTIFRHLKKIIIFAILGVVAGAIVYKSWTPLYKSDAKIAIRYVTVDRPMTGTEQETGVISFGGRGSGYIVTEQRDIIASLDLAKEVADAVGHERIIDDSEREATQMAAAGTILGGLSVENPRNSPILNISVTHPNRAVATEIVDAILAKYHQRQLAANSERSLYEDAAMRETDQMRMRIQQLEEEIRAAHNRAGVVSIPAAKLLVTGEIGRIRQQILETRANVAELLASIAQQEANLPKTDPQLASTDDESSAVPAANLNLSIGFGQYSAQQQRLELLRARERTLALQYTAESPLLRTTRSQIAETETELQRLRQQYPELAATAAVETSLGDGTANTGLLAAGNLRVDKMRVNSLQERLKFLESQVVDLRAEASKIDEVELQVNELERRRSLQASKYASLLESLEKRRLQEELGGDKVNGITLIQSATPAYNAPNKRKEFAAGIAVGIGILGLLWAFLTDLLLDRTIKRPTEIQRNLGIPLFMSMPDLSDKRNLKVGPGANRSLLQQAGRLKALGSKTEKTAYKPKSPTLQAAALTKPEEYGSKETEIKTIAPWDEQHALNEHFEALRDKVITYFESKNLTHKPKLIAMTGLGKNSGVTTIASGLAGSLSKIGEGSVLLIDMTLGHETAQQFYQGKNILNLDEVLDSTEGSAGAKMNNNLYVVAEGTNGTKLPRIMPQRFNSIIPKLKASDFEYIIFDMPPVSAISSTPRLAAFMDIVLMVMESEKTNRDVANQALELLGDSKTHLGAILNKTKAHVPKRLEQDLLSQA